MPAQNIFFCGLVLKKAALSCIMENICGGIDKNIRIGENRMKWKKACSMLLATTLACSLFVTPVFADEVSDLKEQKQEVQNQVNSLQSQLNTLMSKISELEDELITTGEEIAQTEEDLKEAEAEEEAQYEAMKLRIKYMYEEGSGTATVEKVVTSGDISSMLTQAEYSQQVHSYDREKLEEYAATVQKVEDLKTTLETKMDDLQTTQTEYEAQQTELNTTITEKSAEVENLDGQIKEAAKKAAEEAAKKKAAEEAAKKAAEEKAAAEAQSESNGSSNNGGGGSTGTTTTVDEDYNEPSSNGGGGSTGGSGGSSSSGSQSSPSYSASTGNAIVDAAYSQVGNAMYEWGAQRPYDAFDCSGLVQWCYAQAGISIPRTSSSILSSGTIVSDPQPGDICWTPGHVAIYIGGGQMIEAQQDGVPICISSVRVTYYVRY